MKRFEITYFYGPHDEYFVKEETVADMAASGITLAETKCSPEATKKVLPCANSSRKERRNGIKALEFWR